jgi:hypothetical protein
VGGVGVVSTVALLLATGCGGQRQASGDDVVTSLSEGGSTLAGGSTPAETLEPSAPIGSEAPSSTNPPSQPSSWVWNGLIVGNSNAEAYACFGEVMPSGPAQCEPDWPIEGFDGADVPWQDSSETDPGDAFVHAVGHPEDGRFVLDQPVSMGVDSELPPCSTVTGAAGSMLTRFEIDALLDSQGARDAGCSWRVGCCRSSRTGPM